MIFPPGFLSPSEFAKKHGLAYSSVIAWTLKAEIPFKVAPNGYNKMIPEFEALESSVVKHALAKREDRGVIPPEPSTIPPTPVAAPPPQVAASQRISRDEEIFLLARRQAEPYISRAKQLRKEGKCQAEAEVLWLAIECFGYNPN